MVKEAIKEGSVLDILLPRLGRPDAYCRCQYCAPTPDSTRDFYQPSRKTGLHPYPKRTGFLEPQEKRPPLVPQAFQRWVTVLNSLSQPYLPRSRYSHEQQQLASPILC